MNIRKYSIFPLIVIFTFSCNLNRSVKETKITENAENAQISSSDTDINALAAFISGLPYEKKKCYSRIDSIIRWKEISEEDDSLFAYARGLRIDKMKDWANAELKRDSNITTLFYPFSGPDFLNADIFYPDVRQYVLIGLESLGDLPDICNMSTDSVKNYINNIRDVLKDLLVRSYFITSRMKNNLRSTQINGVIPMLSVFIKRTGHKILSIRRIGLDSLGNCRVADSLGNQINTIPGIRIDFKANSGGRQQSIFYFRADLSNKGLQKREGLRIYLSKLPESYSFLKSAAFLMYSHNFRMIRDLIFGISSTILQDDSGIPYRDFDRRKWDIQLYGRFSKPKNELSFYKESALAEAFRHSAAKPLPFSLGYNWGTNHTCMIYAIRK